jgi:hypothetical protein
MRLGCIHLDHLLDGMRMQNPDGITHRNEKQFCPHLGNDNDKNQRVAIGAIADEWPGVKAALMKRLESFE